MVEGGDQTAGAPKEEKLLSEEFLRMNELRCEERKLS